MNYIRLSDSRQAERLRNLHAGRPGLVLCRSPWLALDVEHTPALYRHAVKIGVNFTVLAHTLDYCAGGDGAFWRLVDPRKYPKTLFLTGANPGPPLNQGGNLTDFQVTRKFSTVNAMVALWLAWYVGVNPIRICGAHFARHPDGAFYGDLPLERVIPDRIKRKKYLQNYAGRLPWLAREFSHEVDELRKSERMVEWPGEYMAGEVARLGNAHPQEQLLLEPTIEALSRDYDRGQGQE
jgi:hypothetical protein